MDGGASIITIVYTACDLARNIQRLIRNVRQHDEKIGDLEDKLVELKVILKNANDAYGQKGSISNSPSEQEIRKIIARVVVRCNNDLRRLEGKLKRLVDHGNWVSVTWRQTTIAPVLAEIGKCVAERHERLNMLVQLLQGLEVRQILDIVRTLSNTTSNGDRPSVIDENPNADTDTLKQEATSLLDVAESEDWQVSRTPNDDEESQSPEVLKSKENGFLLLNAIDQRDKDKFESLLSNGETSLIEKDSRDRTPLLLAASLDKGPMVKMILDMRNRQEIDFNATDSVGRTALHYCAEFGMLDEMRILLDNDVRIDLRDDTDCPPAYYAVKERKYKAVKLLLEKGASTKFDWAASIGPSEEIEELLKKASENE